MIRVSNNFKARMAESRDFHCSAVMTLANGEVLQLKDSEFTVGGNSFADAAGTSSLPLGEAVSRSIEIELINNEEQYADVDFFGASIKLTLRFKLQNGTELVPLGTFTVTEPETYGETVKITAHDNMWRADVPYATTLAFPATLAQMYRDICDKCGISFKTSDFANSTYIVDALPEGEYTCRQMLGYIAMLAGGNARINRAGRCEILTYNFADDAPAHDLSEWISLTADTNDITITGVQTSVTATGEDGSETERVIINGSAGYVLTLENPLFAGHEQTAVDLIGQRIVGAKLRKIEGETPAYPLAEFMDVARVTDRRGRTFRTVITDVNFAFFGPTTLACSLQSVVRNASTYASPISGVLTETKRLVARERTARETAMEELASKISTSSGLYSTEESQPDGSTIFYLHDKPTIAESNNTIRVGSEAIGFSTDGGKTYPYGITIDGEVIASILSAEGINADWINTGSIVAKDASGNIVFSADVTTGIVQLAGWLVNKSSISNSQEGGSFYMASASDGSEYWLHAHNAADGGGDRTFSVSKSGQLYAKGATIEGTITATKGKIGDCSIDENGVLKVSAANISGELTASQINVANVISAGGIATTDDIPDVPSESDITTITESTIKTTSVTAQNLKVKAAKIEGKLTASQINVSDVISFGGIATTDDIPDVPSTSDITTITKNTISTTDITAENLKVKAANIDGTLTASQLRVDDLSAITDELMICTVDFLVNRITPYNSSYAEIVGYDKIQGVNIYNYNGVITSSDRAKKNSIAPIPQKYYDMLDALEPVTYKYNDGTSGRTHAGLIAQDVESAMTANDISSQEFGGLVIDDKCDYNLRYEQFIPLLIGKVKALERRVAELENKLKET